jgi:hypothetical protein
VINITCVFSTPDYKIKFGVFTDTTQGQYICALSSIKAPTVADIQLGYNNIKILDWHYLMACGHSFEVCK